ncbi:response regulator [Acidiphilium sp. PA]|uniref:response regulator transcription factor n=1 Tax=Acidiphilium sp. PA TaxID=2871705 RepID=UPI00224323C1|nr:response regulator [Acidiphilium sp. PA]MCW8308651.1 response regulator [Acidiphilium sp. PA]
MPSATKTQILIVEDDPDVGRFLVSALSEAGHEVNWASNGREGMVTALGGTHGLIILDRQLGDDIDGVDILKAVRQTGRTVPALFLSGRGELSDWVQGLQAGGDDYLVKPFSFGELLTRIDELLSPSIETSSTSESSSVR